MGPPLKYDTAYFSYCLELKNHDNTGTSAPRCLTTHTSSSLSAQTIEGTAQCGQMSKTFGIMHPPDMPAQL